MEGVITYDRRGRNGLGGFYLQQADAEQDGDPSTSEALFVYTRHNGGSRGHRVRVTGLVREFHGLTELVEIAPLVDCGEAPLPTPVSLAWPPATSPERLEGMRIAVTTPLVVIDHYNLERFGTLTLAPAPQPAPTQILTPGAAAQALHRQQQAQRLILDDGSNTRFPAPVPYPGTGLDLAHTLRAGSAVDNLRGILDFRYEHWRLQPEQAPTWQAHNPRPEAPPRPTGSTLRVMTLNLGNFFNGAGGQGGFDAGRGAENYGQWLRQSRRLEAAVHAADADVLAVTELENDGYGPHSAIVALTQALGGDWRFVERGETEGHDAIRVGLLYRAGRARPVGPAYSPHTEPLRSHSRPPLVQAFQPIERKRAVLVAVAHFKSKHCRGAEGSNRDRDDGQGCYAARRSASADALGNWLSQLATTTGAAGTLITGDLNSYAREIPLQRLAAAGYHSLAADAASTGYSFRYQGRHGSLDYVLANAALRPLVAQSSYWHINADEPRALDYAHAPAGNDQVPWRSSDHDPLITDLAL